MKNRPIYFTLGVVAVVVFALGVIITSYLSSSNQEVNEAVDLEYCAPGNIGCKPPERVTQPAKGLPGEVRAKAHVGARETVELADRALSAIDNAKHEVLTWSATYRDLLDNEPGKTISGSTALLKDFIRLWNQQQPPTAYNLDGAREDVLTYRKPGKKAYDNEDNAYAPSDDLVRRIEAERTSAEALAHRYQQSRELFQNLLNNATPATGSTQSLREAWNALVARETAERKQADEQNNKARDQRAANF